MNEVVSVVDIAKKQDELLESFINVKHYDMVLTYLESTLFQHLPRFHCPSTLVINVLFTLATLSEYNNADLLRQDFHNVTSERPIHLRALSILETLVSVVKNRKMHASETLADGPNKMFIEQDDLIRTEVMLINALAFLKEKRGKQLRSRALKVQNYFENSSKDLAEELAISPSSSHPEKENGSFVELSPQKKQLQMLISSRMDEDDDDIDIDDEFLGATSDKNSYMILKNRRFDIALGEERMFTAIQWAFHCSRSDKSALQEAWKMWEPVLNLVFEILNIELDAYMELKESSKLDSVSSTTTEAFFAHIGRYGWADKFMEALFPTDNDSSQKIFPNEGEVAKSYFLPPKRGLKKGKIVALQAVPLLKKLMYLSLKWSELRVGNVGAKFTKESVPDIYQACALRLYHNGDINDMMFWFQLTEEEITDRSKAAFIFNTISDMLVQITTYKFQDFVHEDFVFVDDMKNIELLFENVTYLSKDYSLVEHECWGYEMFKDNYSRMNFALFLLFNMWKVLTKADLSTAAKKKLLKLAHIGQEKRYKVLTSKVDVSEDELHNLTDWLKIQLA